MKPTLTSLYQPRSVAIIGASRSPQKVGHQLLKNLLADGFSGPVYPVNPQAHRLLDLPCYPTVTALPRVPDLAVIATPAPLVLPILTEATAIGIPSAVIISAGFAEANLAGQTRQRELVTFLKTAAINVLGPNSLGVLNPDHHLNAAFGPPLPPSGPVWLISQSGALITSVFDWAKATGVGFTAAFSLGNRVDVNENHLLSLAARDHRTRVIAVYLESLSQPTTFFAQASTITPHKPIILLKGGQSPQGYQASASHTAALASNPVLLQAFAQQTQVILADTIETWLSGIHLATLYPKIKGLNLGLVTNAGGPAVVAADHAATQHLSLPSFSSQTVRRLHRLGVTVVHNPLDVLGDAPPSLIAEATKIGLADPAIDQLLTIITPQTMTQPIRTARLLSQLKVKKPFLVSFMGGTQMAGAISLCRRQKLPHFDYPHDALKALSVLAHYHQGRSLTLPFPSPHGSHLSPAKRPPLPHEPAALNLETAFSLLQAYGFILPKYRLIDHLEALPETLNLVGRPAVMKSAALALAHKRAVGAIALDLMTTSHARQAFRRLSKFHPQVLVQQTIHAPLELLLGARRDPDFGPFVVVGLGGSYANQFPNRTYLFSPVSVMAVRRILASSALMPFFRQAHLNLNHLVQAILKLQTLLLDYPAIADLEINPLMGTPAKLYAVDVKLNLTLSEAV